MKRPNFSPSLIMVLMASAILALVSIVRNQNNSSENDNKSKLTLSKIEKKVEQKVGEKALTLKNVIAKNINHQEEEDEKEAEGCSHQFALSKPECFRKYR